MIQFERTNWTLTEWVPAGVVVGCIAKCVKRHLGIERALDDTRNLPRHVVAHVHQKGQHPDKHLVAVDGPRG